MLEDYKVWRTLIQHKLWSTSPIEWSDLFLNGCICWLCEGFYIRRCWKVRTQPFLLLTSSATDRHSQMMDRNSWILLPLSILSVLIMGANLYLQGSGNGYRISFIGRYR
ncbi:hypothetical protein CVT24_012823 [Panaeolus cyanescens]|uniref:Uncharacterized protein n=1 Tax=Panaeolus cyanescens TaxID=181874 RepID=A0A409YJQ3_9AGAR|nr:hypothetical protein CVT24_012823 [Panaeolus cyanescens]